MYSVLLCSTLATKRYIDKVVNMTPVQATLDFSKTSGELPGVDLRFRLRLPVSPEHGWC